MIGKAVNSNGGYLKSVCKYVKYLAQAEGCVLYLNHIWEVPTEGNHGWIRVEKVLRI